MNDFLEDKEYSKKYRNLMPVLYASIFSGCTDIHYFPDESAEQQADDVDLSLMYRGREILLEEKLVKKPYTRIYCETESCSKPGMIADGWMRTSKAHYLVYAFESPDHLGLDVYIFKFPELKERFWMEMAKRPCPFEWHRNPENNQSQGRLVPIRWCIRNAPTRHYFLTFDGGCSLMDELEVNP